MNKTFKIVFNKARGALMVANEITGSVQKKGTRTCVAAGIACALIAASSSASALTHVENISSIEDQVISGAVDFTDGWGGYLYEGAQNFNSSNNTYSVEATYNAGDGAYGGAVAFYASGKQGTTLYSSKFTNDKFVNNKFVANGTSKSTDWNAGGAIAVKGHDVTFTDVVFNGNQVVSNVSGAGSVAVGGAIMLDKVYSYQGRPYDAETSAHFVFNKDVTYTGNTVTATDPSAATSLYGGVAYTSGGFLFMDRHSTADFVVGQGVTFTLGELHSSDKNADTIASSMTTDADATKYGGHNLITKQGAGTFVVNSSLNDYNGLVDVQEGSMVVNSDWKIRNAVTINGGTLDLSNSNFKFSSIAECATDFDSSITVASTAKGSITLTSGTLIAKIGNVFNDAKGDATLNSAKVTETKNGFVFTSGTLALSDSGTYGADLYNSIVDQINNPSVALNFMNATLAVTNDVPLEIRQDTSVAGISSKTLNITSASLSVTGENQSSLGTVTLNDGGAIAAKNNATVKIDTLSGTGKVSVGEANGAGASMHISKLDMSTGDIYVDPEYGHSTLQVDSLTNDTLNANITAGHGAFVTIGADADTAKNAVAKLDDFDSVQSVFYVAKPITIGNGTVNILSTPFVSDSSAVSTQSAGSVTVGSNSALVVDQSAIGSSNVFTGTNITFTDGRLGIVNANVGTIVLTDGTVSGLTNQAISVDNPFIEATADGNKIVNTMSAEGGLGALASTGIQAMTRRADTILAQTIADRTSVDQELAAGTNLWVDVTGERYEADKLDNGGEFKSDMGYGAFGADFAVTQDITAGAAFQYGKGSLRSGVSSIKNSIDSYGVTAYGAMKFGDAKVVAEASYIKNENDITSSQTALNQRVDSEIYSVGVRGQHRFTAGNFQFVPSVGVRVSRLNTDAMQVGAVNVKKQEQTLVQVPIALRVNGFEQNVNGWSVAPSFKVAYVPTFGDKEISVLGADQTVIDTSPVQGDFGIRAQNGNLMVNANMMLGGGKDGTSSVGGKIGLKYVF